MRSHPRTRALATVAASLLSLPLGGCVVAAVGAAAAGYGGYKIVTNRDAREYEVPFDRAWAAAGDATREAGYPVGAHAPQGPSEGAYEVGDVRVAVFKLSEQRSRVEVRVGTFDNADNRRRTRLILDAVSRRLGYEPPS